jgi:hypothetical protein
MLNSRPRSSTQGALPIFVVNAICIATSILVLCIPLLTCYAPSLCFNRSSFTRVV